MGSLFSRTLSTLARRGKEGGGVAEVEVVLEDPPTPPPTDPRLPLTARQLFNITKSWKGIARAMEPTGINMFVRLFEENEDILHLFQKFQHKRITELHLDSMELAQHASIVMNTLDESIKNLNNVDFFMDYLHAVGEQHTKIPGFQREYFWRIERPFLVAVQETLGDRYTDNMENIYKITIRYILDTVVKGFDLGLLNTTMSTIQPPKASPEPSPSSQETTDETPDGSIDPTAEVMQHGGPP
ncbi:hypothetical protein JTE90_013765 [Oedothorax gibbosus]|uniref:Globin domain-containing protein n=1 Tax=Oedothorax gibbosus TaxID=931172 RepID=A0AAV6UXV6_9ARAC|nr:hypothetical protein JTE90_013765 [Oedothorax gibbosus]